MSHATIHNQEWKGITSIIGAAVCYKWVASLIEASGEIRLINPGQRAAQRLSTWPITCPYASGTKFSGVTTDIYCC